MNATMIRARGRSGNFEITPYLEVTPYESGCETGKRWAENACPSELVLLDDLRQRTENDTGSDWAVFFDNNGASYAFTTAERLYFAMHPEHDEDTPQARIFWQRVLGREVRSAQNDAWLHGFADGALDVWKEFERRIYGD